MVLGWFLREYLIVLLVLDRAGPNKTFGLAGKIGVAGVVWQLELLAHRCAKGLILPAHDIVLVGARSAQVDKNALVSGQALAPATLSSSSCESDPF